MRSLMVSLLLTTTLAVSAHATPPTKTQLENLVMERMDVLARVYQITWTSAPTVEIGYPDGAQTLFDLAQPAVYYSKPSSIWYNPLPYYPTDHLGDLELLALYILRKADFDPAQTTDHELGHAYFFNEYLRLTQQTRPHFSGPDSLGQKLGFDVVVEGISNSIEKRVPPAAVTDTLWRSKLTLRDTTEVGSSEWQRLTDTGGYHLMGPLIQAYTLPAVVQYAVNHPLVIHHGRIRQSVAHWRQQAQRDLRRQP